MTLTPTARSKKRLFPMLGALVALGCMPDVPPEADPPEVEVSGGELPEYEYDAADLEEDRSEDRVALERTEREDDFEEAERFLD